MFGLYRFFLATIIVVSHIAPAISPYCGTYAVFAFYILSGYLISRTYHSNYKEQSFGYFKYLLNRFLKIFPIYWMAIIIASGLLLFSDVVHFVKFPESAYWWIKNIILIGMGPSFYDGHIKMMPIIAQGWALHVELLFYLCIPFLGKDRINAVVFLSAALILTFYNLDREWHIRYFSLQGAMLPFCLGIVLTYIKHDSNLVKMLFGKKLLVLYILIFLGNLIYPRLSISTELSLSEEVFFQINSAGLDNFSFYGNLFISFLLIGSLSKLKYKPFFKIDRLLGDLSYPIYLLHFVVAAYTIEIFELDFYSRFSGGRVVLFALSYLFLLIISFFVVQFIDRVLAPLRDKIRQRAIEDIILD